MTVARERVVEATATFSDTVAAADRGQPEAALTGPFETLLSTAATSAGLDVVLHRETHLSDAGAIPDFAVEVDGVVIGYVELKAPGTGAHTGRYTGRNRTQWAKLSALPNILYTDGTEWAVYHQGTRHGDLQRLDPDVRDGNAQPVDPAGFVNLLHHFLTWTPVPPTSYRQLADSTARLCRLLRDEVTDQLATSNQLQTLAADWKDLLFPEADDPAFANQYAQTVTFALLLARADNITFDHKTLPQIALELGNDHSLLGRALQILTDDKLVASLSSSLEPLRQTIGAVNWATLKTGTSEPWLHFYEHFLEIYDPELRKATGSYYTPDEVVTCMVRLVDQALAQHLGMPGGLANDQVTIVDPATGTGTFLLRTIDHIARHAAATGGGGYVPTVLNSLPQRLIGFELQTGPYAVAQLRVFDRLNQPGTSIDPGSLRLYVADTLDDPHTEQTQLPSFYEPISRSRRDANTVKADERVLAILGNPPYSAKAKGKGGWVENGDGTNPDAVLLNAFLPPEGHRPSGNQLQEMRNLHVYFWRWAIHKAFEAHPDSPHGVIGFITPSAWLTIDGLVGMRHYLRGIADHLYVIDLGGNSRGARKEPNVFAIQTPVAITIAVRDGTRDGQDAQVWYRRIRGTRTDKLARLDPAAHPHDDGTLPHQPIRLDDDGWKPVLGETTGPVAAAATPAWQSCPALTELTPWTPPGVKPNRTWVYSPDDDTLLARWATLTSEANQERKQGLFRPSYHAAFEGQYPPLPGFGHNGTIKDETGPAPTPVRVGYRSFDRQWILPDRRLLHSPSPSLWATRSDQQVFLAFNPSPGHGPASTYTAHPPDMPFFQGNADAGGAVIPLWRDADATVPNVTPGLLGHLAAVYGRQVEGPDLFAYIAAVTSHPGFVARFWDELEAPGLRLPLTADPDLFTEAVELGRRIIWAHTYGERFVDPADSRPASPPRATNGPKLDVPIPTDPDGMPETLDYDPATHTLHVGQGRISNVAPEVAGYEVSGMNVPEKWFSYRKRNPAGKKTSDLDRINPDRWTKTTIDELLDLLHTLTIAVQLHHEQAALLDRIMDAPQIAVDQLTAAGILPVPKAATRPLPPTSQPTLS